MHKRIGYKRELLIYVLSDTNNNLHFIILFIFLHDRYFYLNIYLFKFPYRIKYLTQSTVVYF